MWQVPGTVFWSSVCLSHLPHTYCRSNWLRNSLSHSPLPWVPPNSVPTLPRRWLSTNPNNSYLLLPPYFLRRVTREKWTLCKAYGQHVPVSGGKGLIHNIQSEAGQGYSVPLHLCISFTVCTAWFFGSIILVYYVLQSPKTHPSLLKF